MDARATADGAWSRPEPPPDGTGPAPLPIRFWGDLGKVTAPDRLVRRLLGTTALAVIYGDPGSGKTFLAADMALHVALGRPWFGRAVLQGAVLYVAAEGSAGLENRIVAFRAAHETPKNVPFAVVPVAVDLGPSGVDLQAVIAAAERLSSATGLPIRLIVLDTLARTIGAGDENDTRDMGRYISSADRIRAALNATVLIVHHRGKAAAQGARGSSALLGAVDTAIEVEKREHGRVARVSKQKDGDDGQEIPFLLEVVEIGVDDDGEPIASCVVRQADDAGPATRSLSGQQRLAFEQLLNALADVGKPAPKTGTMPSVPVVPLDTWREYLKRASVTSRDNEETERRQWNRIKEALQSKGLIGTWDGLVWNAGTTGTRRDND